MAARICSSGYVNCGTVFSITTDGTEKVLYSFAGGSRDGSSPVAPLLNVKGTLYGTTSEQLGLVAVCCYANAQLNPRAVMYGRPLSREEYDKSRWIVEPFHLFDCCMENDGAAALIVMSAERARDVCEKPAYVLGGAHGMDQRYAAPVHNGGSSALEGASVAMTMSSIRWDALRRWMMCHKSGLPATGRRQQNYPRPLQIALQCHR